jgi:hypothetical protein
MASAAAEAIAFTPGLVCAEPAAGYWLRQVTLRLRREVCWRWHQQGQDGAAAKTLAPGDPLMTSLDLTRYWDDKRGFFETDVTAGYLSDKLAATAPAPDRRARRGSFDWLAATLELDEASAFALALALAPSFDSAVGPVIAACLDLSGQARPTLALAQRLWDRPDQVLPLADPNHPLWRHGLLQARRSIRRPGWWPNGSRHRRRGACASCRFTEPPALPSTTSPGSSPQAAGGRCASWIWRRPRRTTRPTSRHWPRLPGCAAWISS